MHHPTDRIAHTTAFVTPVVVHWLERRLMRYEDRCRHFIGYVFRLTEMENTTRVPVGDDLSYNEWFLKRI